MFVPGHGQRSTLRRNLDVAGPGIHPGMPDRDGAGEVLSCRCISSVVQFQPQAIRACLKGVQVDLPGDRLAALVQRERCNRLAAELRYDAGIYLRVTRCSRAVGACEELCGRIAGGGRDRVLRSIQNGRRSQFGGLLPVERHLVACVCLRCDRKLLHGGAIYGAVDRDEVLVRWLTLEGDLPLAEHGVGNTYVGLRDHRDCGVGRGPCSPADVLLIQNVLADRDIPRHVAGCKAQTIRAHDREGDIRIGIQEECVDDQVTGLGYLRNIDCQAAIRREVVML